MTIRLAVVQQDGNPGQVRANRDKALAHAEEALTQGADIVLFHEELLVGYVDDPSALAEPLHGPTTQAFAELLQGTESLVIYGLTECDGDDLYISAPVVSANGVIANYRKTHLWWDAKGLRYEPGFYKRGNRLTTFDFRGHTCGIMICYDGDFPEMTRSYANLGCAVLFWLNNRNSRGHPEVRHVASGNSMIMAVSCCCGPDEQERMCSGGSNITGPSGQLFTEIWDQEGIIIQAVNPEDALAQRETNPWFVGQRRDLYR